MRPSRPITREQILALTRRLREETLPRLTAKTARTQLARIQGMWPRRYKQFVDGREGAPLETVRPGGNIRFEFAAIGSALEWIDEELRLRSPVGPERGQPHYR